MIVFGTLLDPRKLSAKSARSPSRSDEQSDEAKVPSERQKYAWEPWSGTGLRVHALQLDRLNLIEYRLCACFVGRHNAFDKKEGPIPVLSYVAISRACFPCVYHSCCYPFSRHQRTPSRLQYNLNSPAHFCASREVSQKSQWTISKVSSSTEWIWMPIAHPHPPRPSYNRRKPDPDSPQDWPNRLLS